MVSPEVDFAEVGAVVHARLESGDSAADLRCGQRGHAVAGQMPLRPQAQTPLGVAELVEADSRGKVPPETTRLTGGADGRLCGRKRGGPIKAS
jgi:hypothetical protein